MGENESIGAKSVPLSLWDLRPCLNPEYSTKKQKGDDFEKTEKGRPLPPPAALGVGGVFVGTCFACEAEGERPIFCESLDEK